MGFERPTRVKNGSDRYENVKIDEWKYKKGQAMEWLYSREVGVAPIKEKRIKLDYNALDMCKEDYQRF